MCVNFQNDTSHCGSCTKVCTTGQTCTSGTCTGGGTGGTGGGGTGGTGGSTGGSGGTGGATGGAGGTGGGGGGCTALASWRTNSCNTCSTQTQGDKLTCIQYLDCYVTNGCGPSSSCAQNDGTCGVNKIGGGTAGKSIADTVYHCICG